MDIGIEAGFEDGHQLGICDIIRIEGGGEVYELTHTGHERLVVDGEIHIGSADYDADEADEAAAPDGFDDVGGVSVRGTVRFGFFALGVGDDEG